MASSSESGEHGGEAVAGGRLPGRVGDGGEVDASRIGLRHRQRVAAMRHMGQVRRRCRGDALHAEMRRLGQPLVFVVNEYGLILGMVTEENLAEELVGDIFSHDQKLETQYLRKTEPGVYEIDCMMDIDDFIKMFSLNIQKENFETLGGYILSACARVPLQNEELDLPPGQFLITEATRRGIRFVRFRPRRGR